MENKIAIIITIIIVVLAMVGFNSITTVPTGHAGIKTRFRESTR